MRDTLFYKLHSGKPNKFLFFVKGFLGMLCPDAFYRARLGKMLAEAALRSDYKELEARADYYMKCKEPFKVSDKDALQRSRSWICYTGCLCDYKRKTFHTAYFFDQHDVTRYFPAHFRWNYCPGDVYFTPSVPTVVKSRLLSPDNANSVVLKLDKLRHFMFVDDATPFRSKKDMAIFRGKIRQSRLRYAFLERFFSHPMFDCGVVGKNEGCPKEWMMPKKTIREHLQYKFIMALEGNDVASNLKWVMSSNSLAVMTKPTCETWFMEGKLIPNYHYVLIKDDFSDLEQRLLFYINHPDKAEDIINHAHQYVRQFQDRKRERLISLMVLDKYFSLSGQK